MSDHTPSGQQAVEQMLREEICRMTGWNLSKDDCRNIVEKIHTAAPTAPSTAAGEKTSAVKQMERSPGRWANMSPDVVADGSRAQVVYALKDAQHDIALLVAALATPPAPSVPWQEQAAQIRRDALEEAAKVCDQRAKTAVSHMEATDVPSYKEAFARDAEEAEDCADDIRALLSKPAKGNTTNAD